MSHRFYLPTLDPSQPDVRLTGDQAHHAFNVMRFQVGDEVVLFNGRGLESTAEIKQTAKKAIDLTLINSNTRPRILSTEITIAVAMPKGERQKFLVEKLVETGVNRLIPLKTRRGVAAVNDKVIDRINKQVIEASKQCERAWLMNVESPMTLDELAAWTTANQPQSQLFFGDPYEGDQAAQVAKEDWQAVMIAIGPEGGFTDEEAKQAKQLGFQPVRLGHSILRIETAAIAAGVIFGIGR